MTDYNKVQYSEFVGSGQVVARGESVEEVVEIFEEMAKASDRLTDAVALMRTTAKVKGVTDEKSSQSSPVVKGAGQKSSAPERKLATSEGHGTCDHGLPWTDLKGETDKNGNLYKNRFYCAHKTKNWRERCKPWGENE